jgi:hypothetical protein
LVKSKGLASGWLGLRLLAIIERNLQTSGIGYRWQAKPMEVLRVLHAARDVQEILGLE